VTQESFKSPLPAPEVVDVMALRRSQNRHAPRRLWECTAAIVAVVLLAFAAPAWAADVVAVRVGQHAEFTRIVFELDASSGYRVARTTGADGSATIVVTLDAVAKAQKIRSGSSLVRFVTVDTAAGKTTARITLRKSGLPLKEMILNNPPRIVLDVLGVDTALKKVSRARVAKKAAPAAKPKAPAPIDTAREAPSPAPKPAVAPPTPQTKPTAKTKPAVKPKPVEEAKAPAPAPSKPAPKLAKPPTPPAPSSKPAKTAVAKPGSSAPAPATEAELAAREAMERRLKAVRDAAEARRKQAEKARATREARQLEETRRREQAEASSAVPETDESEGVGIDPMLAGGIAGGVLLLVVLFVVLWRRRSLPKDLDVTLVTDQTGDTPSEAAAAAAMTQTDVAMGDDVSAGTPADAELPVQPTSAAPDSDLRTGVSERTNAPLSAPGLFDETEKNDEPEKGKSTMDQEMHDSGMDTVQSAPVHSPIGSADTDVAVMMREMERRMAQLESRLEEEMGARERLERQVAAQSEELRVQRAAIARTQRALRGLSRTEEEQATEPALRDPS
jgi:hypothetical protein